MCSNRDHHIHMVLHHNKHMVLDKSEVEQGERDIKMKVSILGTEYDVLFKTLAEDQQLEYSDGYTDAKDHESIRKHHRST